MKRLFAFAAVLALLVACMASSALGEARPAWDYAFSGKVVRSYDSDSLCFTVEQFQYNEARCYLTKIWMADPGQQIHKATATWEEDLAYPSEIAKKLDCNPALVVNGSGYVSPVFPWVPEDYPGTNSDYYYTPLGSLTVTNGEVFRHLEGVPFYGLTLQADGLHLHVGDDPADVLAQDPVQTWSFYDGCPLIQQYESILDTTWDFANRKAIRTIVGRMDDNNYFLLTVTNKTSLGLTLVDCVAFLQDELRPEWVYDLDGGPSSALLARTPTGRTLRTIYGNNSKDTDIMAFAELPAAQ